MTTTNTPQPTCKSWCNAHHASETGDPEDEWCVHSIPLAGTEAEALQIVEGADGRALILTGCLPAVYELYAVEDAQDWALMYTKAATMLRTIQLDINTPTPEAGL